MVSIICNKLADQPSMKANIKRHECKQGYSSAKNATYSKYCGTWNTASKTEDAILMRQYEIVYSSDFSVNCHNFCFHIAYTDSIICKLHFGVNIIENK